jgi:hypothetical protein
MKSNVFHCIFVGIKAQFLTDTKVKLAAVHRVTPSDRIFVIIALTEGTVTVTCAMPLMADNMENLAPQFAGQLGRAYVKHEGYPAFHSSKSIQRHLLRHGIATFVFMESQAFAVEWQKG